MARRAAVFWLLCAALLKGAVIDSGSVVNNYSFGTADSPWMGQLTSSLGGFSVQFSTDGLTALGCTPGGILCDPCCLPAGVEAAINGMVVADYGMSGSATVGSAFYPDVGFKGLTGSQMFFQSALRLQSSPFVAGPGSFAIPFTMTGHLRAGRPTDNDLLLDTPITGYGNLYFTLRQPGGPGAPLSFATAGGGGMPHQLTWIFQPAPEPPGWLLVACGAAIILIAARKARTARPARSPVRPDGLS